MFPSECYYGEIDSSLLFVARVMGMTVYMENQAHHNTFETKRRFEMLERIIYLSIDLSCWSERSHLFKNTFFLLVLRFQFSLEMLRIKKKLFSSKKKNLRMSLQNGLLSKQQFDFTNNNRQEYKKQITTYNMNVPVFDDVQMNA